MTGETVTLLIGMGTALAFLLLAWRRVDVRQLLAARDRSPPEEPCWIEQVSTDGRLSYGRYGCYHSDLAEADARARSVEFSAYG